MADLVLDVDSVHGYVGRICFKTGPPGRVGAELEWLVGSTSDPLTRVLPDLLHGLLAEQPFPQRSTFSVEPGGQVEISSQVAANLSRCWRDLDQDVRHLCRVLAEEDLVPLPRAIDERRPPERVLRSPRYDAMEVYFDRLGSDTGRVMMTSTAAVQVNLEGGADADDVVHRWRLLHVVGPTMVAAFANSPVHAQRRTGWKSSRQRVWLELDPSRTAAPRNGVDPATAWAEYALDAPVMMLRQTGCWRAAPGFTFRDWVEGTAGDAAPTEDDLAYHLTTLFPPVRPRGWLEVRYLDAQTLRHWPVPVAVLTALVVDARAASLALEATEPVSTRWLDAARHGLADPALARAARTCFEAAIDALTRLGIEEPLVALVQEYAEQYVDRSRCPADDLVANGCPAGTDNRGRERR